MGTGVAGNSRATEGPIEDDAGFLMGTGWGGIY